MDPIEVSAEETVKASKCVANSLEDVKSFADATESFVVAINGANSAAKAVRESSKDLKALKDAFKCLVDAAKPFVEVVNAADSAAEAVRYAVKDMEGLKDAAKFLEDAAKSVEESAVVTIKAAASAAAAAWNAFELQFSITRAATSRTEIAYEKTLTLAADPPNPPA